MKTITLPYEDYKSLKKRIEDLNNLKSKGFRLMYTSYTRPCLEMVTIQEKEIEKDEALQKMQDKIKSLEEELEQKRIRLIELSKPNDDRKRFVRDVYHHLSIWNVKQFIKQAKKLR